MKKLSKEQSSKYEELKRLVEEKFEFIEETIVSVNSSIQNLNEQLEDAQTLFNDALSELKSFAEFLQQETSDFFESKSETWQSGNQDYSDWIEGWGNLSGCDDLSISLIDEIDNIDNPLLENEIPEDKPIKS